MNNQNKIDPRLLGSYGNPINKVSCSVFNELDSSNPKQLQNFYLKKPLGNDEYYNQKLECLDKNIKLYNKKLKLIKDPKDMQTDNKKEFDKIKLNEIRLRKKRREAKKKMKKICVKKKKFF